MSHVALCMEGLSLSPYIISHSGTLSQAIGSPASLRCQRCMSLAQWPGGEWVTRGLMEDVEYKYIKAYPLPREQSVTGRHL